MDPVLTGHRRQPDGGSQYLRTKAIDRTIAGLPAGWSRTKRRAPLSSHCDANLRPRIYVESV